MVTYPVDFPISSIGDLEPFESQEMAINYASRHSEEFDRLEVTSAREVQTMIYKASFFNNVGSKENRPGLAKDFVEQIKRSSKR